MEYRLRQRAAMPPDESGRIDVMHADLTEGERRLLLDGLAQWGGPARPTNELAVALGFADLSDFDDQRRRLSDSLASFRWSCRRTAMVSASVDPVTVDHSTPAPPP
jgi:hypothetical protein